ncbi:AC5 [Tomato chlorotic mottle virus]|uniref:AC5 n=1 Tax=Tomato chlorotic mottle virus-Crumple TaxID=223339 RepID=Q8QMH0_9GEMI|nr:AC5 [Tomato chlorotic mottle virus-Crumple]
MILVLSGFLMVIDDMIVDLPEPLDKRLLVACVLSTCDLSIELVHNLKTITEIVFHSGGARLVVEHVKHLAKVHRGAIRSTVPHQPKHGTVRVVLQLDVLIHPYLTQNIHRLNTETLTHTMCNTVTTGDIGDTHHLTSMGDIVTLFKRLDFTWAFTTPWNIGGSINPIYLGLPVHRPVYPVRGLVRPWPNFCSRRTINTPANLNCTRHVAPWGIALRHFELKLTTYARLIYSRYAAWALSSCKYLSLSNAS